MLDPILLKTFLTVAETRSFTQAGIRLGISQPTVSQHVRRLEASVARTLLTRDTRGVALTDNGEAMAGFARSILAAHASADAYFSGSATRGRLRFGVSDDLANTQLPRILRDFRRLHPQINLELTVHQSMPLLRRLQSGQLDLVFVRQTSGESVEGARVASDQMVWMAQGGIHIEPNDSVPLITYPAPSLNRQMAIEALESDGRTWRVTCNTRDVNGVLAAVRAGIGVAVFPHSLIPADLQKVSQRLGLPDLPAVEYVLRANPLSAREPVEALTTAILSRGLIPAI